MAWVKRGAGQYYYRSVWHNGTCRTEYIGTGLIAELRAQLDESDRQQRQAEREAFRQLIEHETEIDQQLDALGEQVRYAVTLIMVATGHHQHRRQWRRSKVAKVVEIKVQTPPELSISADELNALIRAVNSKRPTQKQRAELVRHLDALPELAKTHGDAQEPLEVRLIEALHGSQDSAGALAARVHLDNLRKGMGYADASVLERMLIDQIVLAWLRLQLVEWRNLNSTLGDHNIRQGDYWERRLSAAQRRYLRACESLARIRRLNVKVQVNVAHQQIVT